jgi:DNA-binding transcriptional MerR regulator
MSTSKPEDDSKLLHVGEFAKAIGKTVRALHLYEEMELLTPVRRTKGGFRLYDAAAVERARWIVKLQNIGFTLAQIQGFVRAFESAETGRDASAHARSTFENKLSDLRQQIEALRSCEQDLVEAIAYLDACTSCDTVSGPDECRDCGHPGHDPKQVPHLYAGLSDSRFDVPVDSVRQRSKSTGSAEEQDGIG